MFKEGKPIRNGAVVGAILISMVAGCNAISEAFTYATPQRPTSTPEAVPSLSPKSSESPKPIATAKPTIIVEFPSNSPIATKSPKPEETGEVDVPKTQNHNPNLPLPSDGS